jgi:predicted metal-dependent hydrolase
MVHSIQFGSKTIEFTLQYAERKSLGISVTPEMEVLVNAPVNATIEKVLTKVKLKAPWIIKQQSYFLSFGPKAPAKKYVGGESHLYLGREYRLKLAIGKKEEVHYKGAFIEVTTMNKSNTKALLNKWYRERAKLKFAEIAEPFIQRFKKYDVEPKGIYIQEMPKRWGSCTPKGKIILNPELIKAPKGCIEYVIIHELCHLIHPNHSNRFIELQTKEMPDWEKWKNKLEVLLS